jgi:hypothetical protein
MNQFNYTFPVPMPQGAFQAWANHYQAMRDELVEHWVETSDYADALSVIEKIKNL